MAAAVPDVVLRTVGLGKRYGRLLALEEEIANWRIRSTRRWRRVQELHKSGIDGYNSQTIAPPLTL